MNIGLIFTSAAAPGSEEKTALLDEIQLMIEHDVAGDEVAVPRKERVAESQLRRRDRAKILSAGGQPVVLED